MSDFPGYPSPYSTWNQFTSARAAIPIGNLPIPGLITGVSSLQSSAYFPFGLSSLADPLSPLVTSSYRALPVPAVPSRFLPGLGSVPPSIGIEPSYGCGLQQPRNLLHSPNFVFSQNPSPLTFDQVYRSSGCSSVSPVSQYRSQFDQRCVNSRLLLTGRLSEPLARDPVKNSLSGAKEAERRHADRENTTEVKSNREKAEAKPAKIWNPFESDSSKADDQKEDTYSKSKFSIESLTKTIDEKQSICEQKSGVDANGNTLKKRVPENENKVYPKQPVPQYPIKPIPLYDSSRLAQNAVSEKPVDDVYHTISPLTQLTHISSKHFSAGHRPSTYDTKSYQFEDLPKQISNTQKKSVEIDKPVVIVIEDDSNSKSSDLKVTRDVNQNSETSKNCNIQKEVNFVSDAKESNYDKTAKNCVNLEASSETADVSAVVPVNPALSGINPSFDFHKEGINTCNSDRNNVSAKSAPGSFLSEEKVSNVDFDFPSVNLDVKCSAYCESNYFEQQVPYACSVPSFAVESAEPEVNQTFVQHKQSEPVRENLDKDSIHENTDLSLKVKIPEDFPKDNTSSGLKSPLCSPSKSTKEKPKLKSPKLSKRDELSALSSQVNEIRNRRNSINKERDGTKLLSPNELTQEPQFNIPCESHTKDFIDKVRSNRKRRMSAGGSAVTMLKNSEDSLSASISSSQISESDSDTQMSNEHAEKLFTESQSPNTQDVYQPPNNAENRSYLPPNMSCDGQYYKANNAPMCQTVSDNQKPPYLCVQDQNRFNEKSDMLPQYGCYPANQSSNVLPEPGSFQAQDEESSASYPQSSQPIDPTLDSSVDYDDNSVMSESHGVEPECDSQHSVSQSAESSINKQGVNSSHTESINSGGSFITDSDQALQWEFLHSKQYIDNIYCRLTGCEAVKTEEENLRDSDSPKTFLDLDKTTQEKKARVKQEMGVKDFCNSKHFSGKSYSRPGYPNYQRHNQVPYGNQSYEMYGNPGNNRWHNFPNQSKMPNENDGGHYEQNQNHYRNNYQSGFSSMNQGQNGGDKSYNQSGFHGNEYNQNDSNYYNQNQPVKGYQGSYGNSGRYDGNYYQNKGSGDFNSQNNMYNPNSGEVGQRFSGQGYGGGQANYSQHYSQQQPSNGNMMGQYQNNTNQNFPIPRNASPASTGSDFSIMEPQKKKRGRKRKSEKESHDENKPRPNTIVTCPTSIGPLIDIDNPDCPIETYDYNNQIETIFNFTIEDDLSPIGAQFLDIEKRICQKLMPIKYGHPVNVIYSPLTYAFQTHRDFVAKFCNTERTILFLGMNPGPYGMSQNGVRKICYVVLHLLNLSPP